MYTIGLRFLKICEFSGGSVRFCPHCLSPHATSGGPQNGPGGVKCGGRRRLQVEARRDTQASLFLAALSGAAPSKPASCAPPQPGSGYPMQTTTTTLSLPPDCSLKATVLSHGWHECSPLSWCEGGSCLQLIERGPNGLVRVSVTGLRGRRRSAKLEVRLEAQTKLGRAELSRLRALLCHVLALEQDLTEFHELCRTHPKLHVLPRLGAGRLLRAPTVAENVIKVICATNVTWAQAVKSINRLAQLGPALPHFVHLNAWPTPAEILKAGPDYLKGVCRLGYRADFILWALPRPHGRAPIRRGRRSSAPCRRRPRPPPCGCCGSIQGRRPHERPRPAVAYGQARSSGHRQRHRRPRDTDSHGRTQTKH